MRTLAVIPPSIDLSIIVPAYNEERRIAPTLSQLHRFLRTSTVGTWEIIVVDDGSSDGTAALVEGMAREIPGLRCVRSSPNRGKGRAVKVGMLSARGAVRLMCDADGSMPAAEMTKLLARIGRGTAEIAIGSRYADGAASAETQPLYRRLWSRLCNQVIQRSLVPGVRDTQCGFKAFTAGAAVDLFSRAKIEGWAFDLEILALAKRRGYRVEEVGVSWTDDRRSRVNPLKDMWKVIREAMAIRKNLKGGVYGELAAPAA